MPAIESPNLSFDYLFITLRPMNVSAIHNFREFPPTSSICRSGKKCNSRSAPLAIFAEILRTDVKRQGAVHYRRRASTLPPQAKGTNSTMWIKIIEFSSSIPSALILVGGKSQGTPP